MYLQKSAMLDCISVTAVGPATYLELWDVGLSESRNLPKTLDDGIISGSQLTNVPVLQRPREVHKTWR